MKLTKYEQETIIIFNEQEGQAEVYTHNIKLKNKLVDMAKRYPDAYKFISDNEAGGVTYSLPKRLVNVRAPISEDKKQKAREYALEKGLNPRIKSVASDKKALHEDDGIVTRFTI